MRNTLLKLTAIIIPGVYFIIRFNYKAALICFMLQLSVIGWVPASLWALTDEKDERTKKKVDDYLKNIRKYNRKKKYQYN